MPVNVGWLTVPAGIISTLLIVPVGVYLTLLVPSSPLNVAVSLIPLPMNVGALFVPSGVNECLCILAATSTVLLGISVEPVVIVQVPWTLIGLPANAI